MKQHISFYYQTKASCSSILGHKSYQGNPRSMVSVPLKSHDVIFRRSANVRWPRLKVILGNANTILSLMFSTRQHTMILSAVSLPPCRPKSTGVFMCTRHGSLQQVMGTCTHDFSFLSIYHCVLASKTHFTNSVFLPC